MRKGKKRRSLVAGCRYRLSPESDVRSHLRSHPAAVPVWLNPEVPGDPKRIIIKPLKKDPNLRYQPASENQRDFQAAEAGSRLRLLGRTNGP